MLEKNSRCGKRQSFHNDGFYCCKSRLISVKRCLNVVSPLYVSHLIHLTHFWHEKCINFNPVINRDSIIKFTHCLYDREKQVSLRIKLAFKDLENKISESEVTNRNSEKILKNYTLFMSFTSLKKLGRISCINHTSRISYSDCKNCKNKDEVNNSSDINVVGLINDS